MPSATLTKTNFRSVIDSQGIAVGYDEQSLARHYIVPYQLTPTISCLSNENAHLPESFPHPIPFFVKILLKIPEM